MNDQHVWEAPKITPPEFRLYYDNAGKVVCYTCEKLEGNYIVIDVDTYAAARPDVRVINGTVSRKPAMTANILMQSDTEGTTCAKEDISIIVDSSYSGSTTKWKLTTYEL